MLLQVIWCLGSKKHRAACMGGQTVRCSATATSFVYAEHCVNTVKRPTDIFPVSFFRAVNFMEACSEPFLVWLACRR